MLFRLRPRDAGELFAGRASGAQLLPVVTAIAVAMIVLAVALRVVGWWSVPRDARVVAAPFACVPPLAFVLLELLEGLLHRGLVPIDEALEPTFLLGLALQMPFAVVAYLVVQAIAAR